jgi:hypothetical protein
VFLLVEITAAGTAAGTGRFAQFVIGRIIVYMSVGLVEVDVTWVASSKRRWQSEADEFTSAHTSPRLSQPLSVVSSSSLCSSSSTPGPSLPRASTRPFPPEPTVWDGKRSRAFSSSSQSVSSHSASAT